MKQTLLMVLALFGVSCLADEGMWQPHQLPEISDKLSSLGLQLDPNTLTSLTEFPMNAIVSLGGCSASFVSPKGLVVTNHHCVYGSVQYNSTPSNNLLEGGFLAHAMSEELPAAPGSRVYVTEAVTEVTEQVLANASEAATGIERYNTIEENIKALIADCEASGIHRCSVPAFHQGLSYFLIKQLEIRDVRLVYAPATSIGKYGGDIDNWMWPRHTGDFGFYRAYVGTDGKPADFKHENVPYQSSSYLKVSASGLKEDDFVMALGYPGNTNRYRTADEVQNQFTWYYPQSRRLREDMMAVIETTAESGSSARIAYEDTYARLANYAKNFKSMTESYSHSDFLARKIRLERELGKWITATPERQAKYGTAVSELAHLIDQTQLTQERDLILAYLTYAMLPSAAVSMHRLALEQQKPDAEREPGFQQRDMIQFEQRMKIITRRYDTEIEKALLTYLLERYAELPGDQRLSAIDQFFGLDKGFDRKKLVKRVDKLYAKTHMADEDYRLAWLTKPEADFAKSRDPMIKFAVAIQPEILAIEQQQNENQGMQQLWRPRYMEVLIAYYKSRDLPIYADANSTLRVTYGQVKGNKPRDGLINLPFTRLEGITEKDTGEVPFNAPQQQLDLIDQKYYGDYRLPHIDSVPVNYLTTLDITGGNSGSATLNGRAQLVGLLFDGVYESIIGDWDFNDEKNRAISVDTRYMLWVMKYLDKATNLLDEMEIVRYEPRADKKTASGKQD